MIIEIFNKNTRKNFEKSLNKILHTCSRSWRRQLNQGDMRVREHMHMHTFDRGLKKSKCHRYAIIEREKEKREKKHLYSYAQNYVVYYVTLTLSRKKRIEQVCTSLDHDNLNYYGKDDMNREKRRGRKQN